MKENIGLIKNKKTTYKWHKVNITKDKNDDWRYIVKIDGDWVATPNWLEFSKFIAEYFIDWMEYQKEIMKKEIEKLKDENEKLKEEIEKLKELNEWDLRFY